MTEEKEMKKPQAVEVGKLFAILQEGNLVNVELEFNSNLTGADTAATVLSRLNYALHDVQWSTRNVMRVANRDAQTKADGDKDGDTDDSSAEPEQTDGDAA